MKKRIAILSLSLLLFFCSGCINNANLTDVSQNNISYLAIDLPQFEKESQRIYYVEWGRLTEDSFEDSVMIFSDAKGSTTEQSDIYMIAEINEELLLYDLGIWDNKTLQNGSLYLTDLDGDRVDEIILCIEVTGNAAKPSQNAQTVHKVPTTGAPNTSFDKLYSGNTGGFQRTYYDFKGNVSLQIDFTYHNNPSIHSNPHLHIWGSSGRGNQINLWYLE